MDIKFNTPRGFCQGTGVEPGQTDCVWCDNTGIDWAGKPGDMPVAIVPAVNPLRVALEHIQKTAGQSRTQTRRLRWIAKRAELALAGRPYVASEHELPPNGDSEHFKLLRQKAGLKDRAVLLEGLLLQTNELLYAIQGDPGAVPSSSIDAMRGKVFTALKPAEVAEAPNEPCRYPSGIMCPGDGTGKACANCPMQRRQP